MEIKIKKGQKSARQKLSHRKCVRTTFEYKCECLYYLEMILHPNEPGYAKKSDLKRWNLFFKFYSKFYKNSIKKPTFLKINILHQKKILPHPNPPTEKKLFIFV